jgi:hypothetical protein
MRWTLGKKGIGRFQKWGQKTTIARPISNLSGT